MEQRKITKESQELKECTFVPKLVAGKRKYARSPRPMGQHQMSKNLMQSQFGTETTINEESP